MIKVRYIMEFIIVCLLLGPLFFFIGIVALFAKIAFFRKASVTKGTVIDIRELYRSKTRSYYPVVEYVENLVILVVYMEILPSTKS
jgi:hypothetical protein